MLPMYTATQILEMLQKCNQEAQAEFPHNLLDEHVHRRLLLRKFVQKLEKEVQLEDAQDTTSESTS